MRSARPLFRLLNRPALYFPSRPSIYSSRFAIRNVDAPQTLSPNRHNSAVSPPVRSGDSTDEIQRPTYQLTFTCKPCLERSAHIVTKQGYHKGTVLVTCPKCKNRHVISDHLKIFSDTSVTIEDILREKGQFVRKAIGREGDLEFWDDKTTTEEP